MTQSKNPLSSKLRVGSAIAPILLLLAFAAASTAGQDVTLQPALTPGTLIRIQAPEIFPGKVVGTVKAVSNESVTIDIPGRSESVSVLREKIARLDVSNGPRSRGVDAAIGAGIGAAVGAASGALANGSGSGHIVSGGAVAGVCALLGAGVGALIGAAIPPGEHWKPILTDRYRVSFAPRIDHGLDLAFAWNF
jgi:hypothetical protein